MCEVKSKSGSEFEFKSGSEFEPKSEPEFEPKSESEFEHKSESEFEFKSGFKMYYQQLGSMPVLLNYHNKKVTDGERELIAIISNEIIGMYNDKIYHSNCCGNNARELIENFRERKVGTAAIEPHQIIMSDGWDYTANVKSFPRAWGSTCLTIYASYHALFYCICRNAFGNLYLAFETTVKSPYKLQVFIAETERDLVQIILNRYANTKLYVDLDGKHWIDVVYKSGYDRVY
jgi:hypothetical protein